MGTSRTKKAQTGIVETLREAIRKSARSHYSIAKSAGVTPAQLDRFARGERDLTLTTAAKVATELGLVLVSRSG